MTSFTEFESMKTSAVPGGAATAMCASGKILRSSCSAGRLITASPTQVGARTTMRLILCGFNCAESNANAGTTAALEDDLKPNFADLHQRQSAAANLARCQCASSPKCNSRARAPAARYFHQTPECTESCPRLYRQYHAAKPRSQAHLRDYRTRVRQMNR